MGITGSRYGSKNRKKYNHWINEKLNYNLKKTLYAPEKKYSTPI